MTETAAPDPNAPKRGSSPAASLRRMPRWKILAIAAAAALLVLGITLGLTAEPTPPTAGGPTTPGTAASFVETEPGATGAGAQQPSWSAGFTRMGLSFFVAFAIGLALRTFLRVTLIFVGVLALLMIGLEYIAFITINWETIDESWNGFASRIGDDFEHLATAVTGRLPQAGLGGLGLVAGLKKS